MLKNMLDLLNLKVFWLKSLKELNVQESTFPGVFRRQLDLLKKLIEIVLGTNCLIHMLTSSKADNIHLRHLHLCPHRTDSYKLFLKFIFIVRFRL